MRLTAQTRNGKTTVSELPILEWKLQAAAVTALRRHEHYGILFTYAGDMNAGKRGRKTAGQAKATGMMAGEPDLRIYTTRGLLLIEYKSGTSVTKVQRERHALLRSLGYQVEVIKVKTEAEAEYQTLLLLNTKLGLT